MVRPDQVPKPVDLPGQQPVVLSVPVKTGSSLGCVVRVETKQEYCTGHG